MTSATRLRTFWFEFDLGPDDDCPRGTRMGAGVTAFDVEDARGLLGAQVFTDCPVPPIRRVVEDVDAGTLDPWLVLENMLPPTDRGVWFPAMNGQPDGRSLAARVREALVLLRRAP